MTNTTRARQARKARELDEATRCPHCREKRVCAPLTAFQELNALYPLPGVFSMLWDIERLHGHEVLLTSCIACGCFQPVGLLPNHDH